jgi:hypothetical protein
VDFAAMKAILYQVAVEKYRFGRILCGFFHFGTSKVHKCGVFSRWLAVRRPFSAGFISVGGAPDYQEQVYMHGIII